MSLASSRPQGSQMKPVSRRPSASSSLPSPSGAAMPATNVPSSLAGSSHTSTAMLQPPLATRTMPGRAGGPPASAYSR